MKNLLLAAAAIIALASAGQARAQITTYTGSDDGSSTSGPWPNSAAAQSSFLTAADVFGTVSTATFESLPTGFYSPIAAGPGLSISLSEPNYGACFSGVTNCSYGSLYGFNTTSGGSNYLGLSSATATLSFAGGTNSVGMYLTGLQTVFTSSLTFTFNDGASETLNLPVNENGGAEYYGFTDATAIARVTITNSSNDAWGVDDISYNYNSAPEPASLLLLGAGLAGLGLVRRKRA